MSLEFGTFLAAFGNGYRMMTDTETGDALRKEEFCRELLCAISSNEDIIKYIDGICDAKHKRAPAAFQSFYRNGKQRRSLHPIAEQVINSGNLSEAKFKRFLENYTQHFSREKLLENLLRYLPETTEYSLFEDITSAFVGIIQKAAAEPDMRRKSSAPVSAENGQDKNVISSDDRCDIKKIIIQLFRTIDKLQDCSLRLLVNMNEPDNENRREYEKYLAEFKGQNAELYYYTALYPQLTLLEQINTLANGLDFSAKYEVTEQGLMIHHDPRIEGYRQYLQQLARLIQK